MPSDTFWGADLHHHTLCIAFVEQVQSVRHESPNIIEHPLSKRSSHQHAARLQASERSYKHSIAHPELLSVSCTGTHLELDLTLTCDRGLLEEGPLF